MLTTTFYSFKGGVGRTRALLNVALRLARSGVSVVAVDFDLEAPGFDHAGVCEPGGPGVSNFVASLLAGEEANVGDIVAAPSGRLAGTPNLSLIRAGTMASQLSALIPSLYGEDGGAGSSVFQRFQHDIEKHLAPDVLLIDSRTGLADIAGVCTVELPELVVFFTNLDPQSVEGVRDVAEQMHAHPARAGRMGPGFLLVYSNTPQAPEGHGPTRAVYDATAGSHQGPFDSLAPSAPMSHPVLARLVGAQNRLDSVYRGHETARKRFPTLGRRDLVHVLQYDPGAHLHLGAVGGEGAVLEKGYSELALAVAHAAGHRLDEASGALWVDLERVLSPDDGR